MAENFLFISTEPSPAFLHGWRREKKKREVGDIQWRCHAETLQNCYHVKHLLLEALALLFILFFVPLLMFWSPSLFLSLCLGPCVPHTPTLKHFPPVFCYLDTSCTFPIQQFLSPPDDTTRFHTSKEHRNNNKTEQKKKYAKQNQVIQHKANPTSFHKVAEWERDSLSRLG